MGDFFEEVDDLGIVERHIKAATGLEENQSKKLIKTYSEIRRELRDRLDRTKSNTFTAQQLRGTLAQIDGAITAMTETLKGNIGDGAEKAALLGVDDLMKELSKFQTKFKSAVVPIDINTALIAQDTSNFLINNYESSLDAYGSDLLSQLSSNLTNAAIQGDLDFSTVSDKVSKFFIGEEWKLSRIVRTELHQVYNLGKQNGMLEIRDEYLPDMQKALIHPMDSRTGKDSKELAAQNPIVDIDKPFIQKYKGKTYTFMVPPNRPNDRAILIPYRKVWDK